MYYQINNGYLSVKIADKGAELQSIRLSNSSQEFLWSGNSEIWGRRAPILFPVVGRLTEDAIRLGNQRYHMTKHGFAQDAVFHLSEKKENRIRLTLLSDSEMLKIYPYEFRLDVEYTLEKNSLITSYEVSNKGQDIMFFSIGGHPGFNCSIGDTLDFEVPEQADTYAMNKEGYIYKKEPFLKGSDRIIITQELFKNDAIMLQNLKSSYVILNRKNYSIKVSYYDAPYLGIWAKCGAPYVCIEPWFGINDWAGSDCCFDKKLGIQRLQAGDQFKYSFKTEIVD